MGLRGPGATRARLAREQAEKSKRRLPWKKKGLTRVGRVIAFLEFLPITKGKLAGKRMKLLPEQREFVKKVYGRSGANRVRLAIKSEPRGNGKTGLISGLALCHLLGPESEQRGEVYSAAIDRQQAGLIFNEMEAIILAVPEFAARVNPQRFHKRMEVLDGDGAGSIYEALSADARRAHGLAPSFWVYDELAQARDGELLENLRTAMGKRKAALGMVISTQAPTDDHPLSMLIDDALEGHDSSIVIDLRSAPLDADPFSRETIKQCNPAAGVFLDLDDVVKEAEQARRVPMFEARYRNLRLNQRIDGNAENRIVTRPIWEACKAEIDVADLKGRKCFGGLDLSGKHDLCALVLAFPDDDPDPGFDLLSFFWTPEGQMEARRDRERELFRVWISKGHITSVPGPVIKYRYMAAQLGDLVQAFDIQAIGFDRWRIDDFKVDMADEGVDLPLEPYGQGFKDISPAIEFFVELALSGRLRHDGNPVMNSCVANAITVKDPAGNMKVDKERSNRSSSVRIDGLQAALMALGTAKRFAPETKPEPKYQMFAFG
ncbi:terminase large subunit [Nitratireductor aquimarinus]|uniref:terminase large subunit n=1 Tax=Nitratireductor TaxID=245876 RepID=UPI0019D3BED4|nr:MULTISPECIES: terminase TerL endonuclease subunit [Nitratireductor]MBN7777766.1 terminase large subunit [Nitratireductor pacificus]MBN7781760.1 terminase large subunit [Nitratireductor pacificus]MBN7790566.1 terminase large subunit [Nitratireductor aquimarinus]MBY6099976.1 terminase family protein [Nitratireductor aquimarinus]MCA1260442.1 terminase large subunit [Nitratireductor aquimarinus]